MPNRPKRDASPHRDAAAELSRRLRDARRAKQVSQQVLASSAVVAIGTVRALERGRSVDPSFFTVLALARALDLDPVNLVAGIINAIASSDDQRRTGPP